MSAQGQSHNSRSKVFMVTSSPIEMEKLLLLLLLAVSHISLVSCACDAVTDAATYTSERAANAVEMKFYRAQTTEWISDSVTNKVAAQVISKANSYCASNTGTCGLQSCCTSAFKETMVVVSSGYPQDDLKDLLLKISLDFPSDLNSTGTPQCVMGKSALQTIIREAREAIHDDTGFWITYIDDEFTSLPPPTELNKIIIPIACAVILGLAILTIILNVWNKKKEESLRRKKIIEQRKKSKKDPPMYNVDTRDPKAPSGLTGKMKDQLYRDNLKKSTKSAKKTASIASEDSAIKVDTTDSRQRQAFSYEKELDGASGYDRNDRKGYGGFSEPEAPPSSHLKPIDSGADDESRSPEKKKKKKKKRSKSKEVMDGIPNDGYTNTDLLAQYKTGTGLNNHHYMDNKTYDNNAYE
ncbi:uncharacterized protein LOC123540362 isoform X8 [Mercenaria mercenaria]|uniref:uncharacterized protein LOC123540362 isoform X8 n=1 Tax=Mercenaria mercenaria TaxID=6596 RepID=UPI00234FB094|nr:uncharacterized protein LOC123540362 isoform X8 [Mercenaria mercenaria]